MHSAHAYTHCLHGGCQAGPNCLGAEALKLASYTHMQDVLRRIAEKLANEDPATLHPSKASVEAVRAVAAELLAVVQEMSLEFKLRVDVASGEAADC